jgi:predicted MFS family arabinose efflux permease
MDEIAGARRSGFGHALRAFRHRAYAVFWTGALVSNSGTWLQGVTVPYVLLELTGRASWVGIATFATFIPTMLLGPVGGSLADRHDRRTVLIIGQSAAAAVALALWAAWLAGVRSPVALVAITALGGLAQGLTIPAWQAFVPSLVPLEDLASAISLNSLQFNAARAIGPAIAGALLAWAGPSAAFLLNGLSFVAVLVALVLISSRPHRRSSNAAGIVRGFTDSLRYIRSQPGIFLAIGIAVLVAFLGYPVVQFAVVFAQLVYGVGPVAVGLLTGVIGLGAIAAAPFVSGAFGDLPREQLVRWALPLYGLALLVFGTSTTVVQGAIGLFGAGAGFLALVASTNTAVQSIVADHMRGRVMATRIMSFTGAFPLGALLQSSLADVVSPRLVVSAAAVLLLIGGFVLMAVPGLLGRLDDPPDLA